MSFIYVANSFPYKMFYTKFIAILFFTLDSATITREFFTDLSYRFVTVKCGTLDLCAEDCAGHFQHRLDPIPPPPTPPTSTYRHPPPIYYHPTSHCHCRHWQPVEESLCTLPQYKQNSVIHRHSRGKRVGLLADNTNIDGHTCCDPATSLYFIHLT